MNGEEKGERKKYNRSVVQFEKGKMSNLLGINLAS